MDTVDLTGYGPDHAYWLGDSEQPPTGAAERLFRLDGAIRATHADLAAIEGPQRELAAGSAFRDARLVRHLRDAGGDETDLETLIGLGDAFTSPRAAWQQWHASTPAPAWFDDAAAAAA